MTTIINASNGSTSGLITTADASGVLQLQTNNGTPALTLNTTQALGVGSSPSYGTIGQFLTSQGSAASPTWTTPSSGAMTLISTLTANNTSPYISWTGLSGYNDYMIEVRNITLASSGGYFGFQVGTGVGPTWQTGGYTFQSNYVSSGSAGANGSTSYYMAVLMGRAAGCPTSGTGTTATIFIRNMNGTSGNGYLSSNSLFGMTDDSSVFVGGASSGGFPINSTVKTAIRLIGDYNLTGTASLYGISS